MKQGGCQGALARYQWKDCPWASSGGDSTLPHRKESYHAIQKRPYHPSRKSSTVAERPVVEVDESWISMGRAGTGGISVALSGKSYFKSILAGVLKAFSSCSTKLRRSEAPDSLSMRISPVKSKDSLVSSSEVTSESPEAESAWKTCARKTGIGSVGRIAVSVEGRRGLQGKHLELLHGG
jgi:hypothetical protein